MKSPIGRQWWWVALVAFGEANFPSPVPAQNQVPDQLPIYVRKGWELALAQKTRSDAAFPSLMQALTDEVPSLEPPAAGERPQWRRVKVFLTDSGFGAFSFRSPLTEPANLYLAFVRPPDLHSWSVWGRGSDVGDFPFALHQWDVDLTAEDSGQEPPLGGGVTLQVLIGGKLRPKVNYLVWFAVTGKPPADIPILFTVLPAPPQRELLTAHSIAARLGYPSGLKYRTDQLQFTPASTEEAAASVIVPDPSPKPLDRE